MFDFDANSKFIFDNDSDEFNYVKDKECPRCKTTLSDFYRANIVGCSNCYKVFETEIREIILNKHGAINHVGKVSANHLSKAKLREKIAKLEEEKNLAAEEEDFIRAEMLKNQLEKLKGERYAYHHTLSGLLGVQLLRSAQRQSCGCCGSKSSGRTDSEYP